MRLFIIILCICFMSCNSKEEKEYKEYVKRMYNKKLIFPENIEIKQLDRFDSVYIKHPDKFIKDSVYRITTFIYGNCHACVEELNKWQKIIQEFSQEQVRILFFIYAEIYPTFEIMNEKIVKFKYPIIYDPKNHYVKKNKIPDNKLLNTFLIDRTGKIILIGNPIVSDKIFELYKSKLH